MRPTSSNLAPNCTSTCSAARPRPASSLPLGGTQPLTLTASSSLPLCGRRAARPLVLPPSSSGALGSTPRGAPALQHSWPDAAGCGPSGAGPAACGPSYPDTAGCRPSARPDAAGCSARGLSLVRCVALLTVGTGSGGVRPVQLPDGVRMPSASSAMPALSARLCGGLQLLSQPHTRAVASLSLRRTRITSGRRESTACASYLYRALHPELQH